MPEVILPCPASMNDAELLKLKHRFDDVCQSSTTSELFELCRAGSHLVDTLRSIPRALTWTHEPPRVAGPYYVRQREDIDKPWSKPRIVSIKTLTIAPSEYWQFAGPIAPPMEG